jgi:gamma-glutamyl-gamma-aminobutyrate hydrolase PuuD
MRSLFFVFLTIVSLRAQANHCQLPRNQKLIVGCSYKCDFTYRFRLQLAAAKLGYKIDILDIGQRPNIEEALSAIDGLLVPGGADIDPEYYLDDVTPELASYTRSRLNLVNFSEEGEKRDPVEHEILTRYSNDDQFAKLPLLGICRGMQMMTVVQGIPLYLDIKTELGIPNRMRKLDRIHVGGEGSAMQGLYGDSSFLGFKLHHQGLRVPYFKQHQEKFPLVRITATSHEGKIAEAIEYTHRPAVGVQYHPEKSFSRAAYPVLTWFLTKACENKNSKEKP